MTERSLRLRHSPARKQFKSSMGRVNHDLITILVGLEGVRTKKVTKSATFSTSWNPKDTSDSAAAASGFVRKATMAWAVDALDAYTRMLNREPKFIQCQNLGTKLDTAGQSVTLRIEVLQNTLSSSPNPSYGLCRLAIAWRNILVHSLAPDRFPKSIRTRLIEERVFIAKQYRGLDVDQVLERYDRGMPPTFKETASIVQAVHDWVLECDVGLIASLDLQRYTSEVLARHFNRDLELSTDHNSASSRVMSLWNTPDSQKIVTSLRQTLQNAGFSVISDGERSETDRLIERFAQLDSAQACEHFTSN